MQIPGRGSLRISLLSTCNYTCSYCHNEGQDAPWIAKPVYARLNDIEALIDRSVKSNAVKVDFTGGEPGLYPHLYDLFNKQEYWKSKFPEIKEWVFVTNGTPFF